MKLCEQGQAVGRICSAVHGSADLHNGASHLAFEPDELAEVRDESTIYVNVTRSGNDRPNTIYLDYWWYFPHNPAGAAGGALCGAGFVIAGVTCFDHQSDWEGVTVVLDARLTVRPARGRLLRPAQRRDALHLAGAPASVGRRRPEDLRPQDRHRPPAARVHRARDACRLSHELPPRTSAGWATCPANARSTPIKENRHDGGDPWPRDERADCPTVCLAALPVRRGRSRAGALERLRRRVGNHGVRARGDLHLIQSTGVTGIPGPVPASLVCRRGGRVPERPVHASTATLHEPQALRARDHRQRAAAGAGRLVLVRAGCRLLRSRHERGREHVLPFAQGLAAGARDEAGPGRAAVAGLQRRGGSRRDHGSRRRRERTQERPARSHRRATRASSPSASVATTWASPASSRTACSGIASRSTTGRRATAWKARSRTWRGGSPPSTAPSGTPPRAPAWSCSAIRGSSRAERTGGRRATA